MKVIFFVLVFVLLAFSQNRIDRFKIDDFLTGNNGIITTILADANFPLVGESIYKDTTGTGNILGGERDLQLTVNAGPTGRLMTAQAGEGEWSCSTPNGANGFSIIQWDGPDNSLSIDDSGLNVDLTDTGLGTEFHAIIVTDIETQYTITVTSPGGGKCEFVQPIPGSTTASDYYIPFSSFSNGCDFTKVGAIQISADLKENVDSIFFLFAVSGVANPSPIPSPPPSSIPPPPSPAVCNCMCPIFTCGMIFAQPGDDDDTVDDDTYDDDDLIFRPVYYGPGDDDFDNVIPDDDENEFLSFEGGLTIDANDDDDETTSASSILIIPMLLLSTIALLL